MSLSIVVDDVTNEIKESMLQEILYVDDIDLIAESMAELQTKFFTLKSVLESKGQKIILVKTLLMVSKIREIRIKPSSKNNSCSICGRKMLYYVNLAETVYMEDAQI